jgi:protein phosphatase 1D
MSCWPYFHCVGLSRCQEEGEILWNGRPLSEDHKPENADEMARIVQSGGKVVRKAGVPRVV